MIVDERNRFYKMSNLVIYADESGTHEGSEYCRCGN